MSKFFEDLKASLEGAIAHKQGKIKLRTSIIEVPETLAESKTKEIRKRRVHRK